MHEVAVNSDVSTTLPRFFILSSAESKDAEVIDKSEELGFPPGPLCSSIETRLAWGSFAPTRMLSPFIWLTIVAAVRLKYTMNWMPGRGLSAVESSRGASLGWFRKTIESIRMKELAILADVLR